jgi:chromosome segregation protein
LKNDTTDNFTKLNNEIKVLKARVDELEKELNKKEAKIFEHLDNIEHLEDTIMKLESLIPDKDEHNKSKKEILVESKMALQIDEKEREIRDLKNRMGFLRKEKVQLQQELEKIKKKRPKSIVIDTEELKAKEPLHILVKELQDKVNKQKSIIEQLKSQYINKNEFNDKLKEKEKLIENKIAFSMQQQIDDQKKTIESQKKTIDDLRIDNTKLKKGLDTLEIQIEIKNQKINELTSQKKLKTKRK